MACTCLKVIDTFRFYELPLLHRFGTIERTGLLLDVGANIGNHSVYAAGMLGRRVIAYEPNPQTFACLAANIAGNGLGGLIDPRRLGVGLAGTVGRMGAVDPTNSGGTRLEMAEDGDLTLVSLDDERAGYPDRVAILKIDVEGMEAKVLEGAGRLLDSDHPVVFAETWSERATAALTALLAGHGYRCTGKIADTGMLEFL